MTTIGSTKGLIIVFAVVLAVVVCAGAPPLVQPTQAKTDESSITPETISASLYHTCGVRNDGTLACWGANGYGQSTPPGGAFSQVSAGEFHTCGVKIDGTLACWGANWYDQSTPLGCAFRQVSAGGTHTCGVKSDGSFTCWGQNDYGQSYPYRNFFPLLYKP